MAKTEKYLIGPTLLGEIRQVITRVNGQPDRTSGASQDVRLQELQRPSSPGLRLGVPADPWPKDSLQDVIVYDTGPALQEAPSQPPVILENCVNKLIDVGPPQVVIVGRISGRWYLLAVECG